MKLTKPLLWVAISFVLAACASPRPTPPTGEPPAASKDAEAEGRSLVESFGKQLQNVSLQSPNAPEDMNGEYSPFVTPALLEEWMNHPLEAPGRIVSSPWPDRIEVSAVTEESSTKYLVTGDIMEVTSMELMNGGVADQIPVSITVEQIQGKWLISEYEQKR